MTTLHIDMLVSCCISNSCDIMLS